MAITGIITDIIGILLAISVVILVVALPSETAVESEDTDIYTRIN